MAEFINTIDVLGDDAVIDSIIDRTITEFKDDKLKKVGSYAFWKCTALTNAVLPSVNSIGPRAFWECTALTNVVLPSVTSIDNYAFSTCTALKQVDISSKVAIGSYNCQVFADCSVLTSLVLRDNTLSTVSNTSAFGNTPIAKGTGYIYVPRALVDTYKAATNWSTYATQFRALEDYTVDGTTTGALDETKI